MISFILESAAPSQRFDQINALRSLSVLFLKGVDNLLSASDFPLECIFLKDDVCGPRGLLIGALKGSTFSEIIAGNWG